MNKETNPTEDDKSLISRETEIKHMIHTAAEYMCRAKNLDEVKGDDAVIQRNHHCNMTNATISYLVGKYKLDPNKAFDSVVSFAKTLSI
jgi:hypothetical protein